MNGDLPISITFTPYVSGDITIEIKISPDPDNTSGDNQATRVLTVDQCCVDDTDCDGICNPGESYPFCCTGLDNCPEISNPDQQDSYPPGGNTCGDACECEGNFDGDSDQDGTDTATFKADFGRSTINSPCTNAEPCNGDFDCNGNVDGMDAALFKSDFGRSGINNPCPVCVTTDPWCSY